MTDGSWRWDPATAPWRAWTPAEATRWLTGVHTPSGNPVRWMVAGGWAIDLYLGRVTRPHDDLEIAVLSDDAAPVIAAFAGPYWRWNIPLDGMLFPLGSPAFAATHQTWLWSVEDGSYAVDLCREGHDGDTWVYRRDPTLRLPFSTVVRHTTDGTPYLAPEVGLLFKAQYERPKDLADLHEALPALETQQRNWLRDHLERLHPGHQWLALV